MPQKDQKCFHKLNVHVQYHENEMFERHSGRKERDNIENSVELKEKIVQWRQNWGRAEQIARERRLPLILILYSTI